MIECIWVPREDKERINNVNSVSNPIRSCGKYQEKEEKRHNNYVIHSGKEGQAHKLKEKPLYEDNILCAPSTTYTAWKLLSRDTPLVCVRSPLASLY